MWRPENWENIYPEKRGFVAQREAYESGADAMLEALKATGRELTGNSYNGWWIFISDVDEPNEETE